MGTHGRNAITDIDGNHFCCEQTMDGHDACYDFLYPFFKDRNFPQYPTMSCDTDECDQTYNFCHIDYQRKIFYAGCEDPEDMINMDITDWMDEWGYDSNDPEEVKKFIKNNVDYYKEYVKTKKLREKEGWKFLFEVNKCPSEYECVNSIPVTIDGFLTKTVKYRLWNRLGKYQATHIFENSLICINEGDFRYVYYDQKENSIVSQYWHKLTSMDIEFFKKDNLTDDEVLMYLKENGHT